MQLQIRENATTVPTTTFCTISNESKVIIRSSKINIFVENNTEKDPKTALVPTENLLAQ